MAIGFGKIFGGGASAPLPTADDKFKSDLAKAMENRANDLKVQYAQSQQGMAATTTSGSANGALAGSITSSGTSGGVYGPGLTSNTIFPQGMSWPQETVSKTNKIQLNNTHNPDDVEMDGLRLEAYRQKREGEFLTWLYTLRVGEWGQFDDSYEKYHRVPGGWLVGDEAIFVKFVPRDECKSA